MKANREQAALICAIGASDPEHWGISYEAIAEALDANLVDVELAYDAWGRATELEPELEMCEWDALAEALLRTGWKP